MENPQSPSCLVIRLCETLKGEEIDYCHWKSNAALDRSASGENDLDLLVSRNDALHFLEILTRLGFREAYAGQSEQLPGIRDFYGFDEQADRLIHVHAHFQLVLGNDLTKNYRIPIESAYLRSAVQGDLFRVPAPEYELAILVIRLMLKHETLDAVLMRHGRLSDSERHELEDLLARTPVERVAAVYENELPCIDRTLLDACLQVLQAQPSFWMRIRSGHQIQQKLQPCARRPQMTDLMLKFWKRIKLPIQGRLRMGEPKKRMANGGLLVAIIGGDGSGKTTAINSLYNRFSEEFEIRKFHMGKPAWSLTTVLIRGAIKLGRSLGLYPFIRPGSEEALDTTSPSFPGYPWLIREVCTARDRYLAYDLARRYASNGGVVICDRYPLAEIKIMDGPQVERVTAGMKPNQLIKSLARIEKRYYQQIMLPDLLVALRVDPEISVQRKTDETAESVRSRAGEVWKVDWENTPAHVVDASQSRAEVSTALMKLIWSHL
jgi:thymidylate kinase